MVNGQTNVPIELSFGGSAIPWDTEVDVVFTGPDGDQWRAPAFWAGGTEWRVRFAAPKPGRYTFRSECADASLHGQTGEIEVTAFEGENYLYRHGHLRVAESMRALEHADGKPFFWMGDTWWMGLTTRLDWPDEFKSLAADRVAKGFDLIQIVAGPLPNFDAATEAWHPMQANEAGWSWEKDWDRINPAYYDLADQRMAHLVESGLMPYIIGMWGFYIGVMGVENARKHWRNLVARYGAYPLVWCIAGELELPMYSRLSDPEARKRDGAFQSEAWSDVARYVREIDPYHNPITAHPWAAAGSRKALTDDGLLDVDMLQTGHGGHAVLRATVDKANAAISTEPRMPVVNGEPCYEGIMGTAWQEQQRFVFWTSILSGAAGHTYGAQGIWQMSTRGTPYSQDWGAGFWPEAMHYAGSAQVGLGRKFLERYPWWRFEQRHEPEVEKLGRVSSFAAGIPGAVWVFYLAGAWTDRVFAGMNGLKTAIEAGASYRAFFFDPRTGAEVEIGPVTPDSDGMWAIPPRPTMEDWVLVLETERERDD